MKALFNLKASFNMKALLNSYIALINMKVLFNMKASLNMKALFFGRVLTGHMNRRACGLDVGLTGLPRHHQNQNTHISLIWRLLVCFCQEGWPRRIGIARALGSAGILTRLTGGLTD